jgi:uncharacterized protein YbjQ (UPF0145 family)
LTPNEFGLLQLEGYAPLGQVMGSTTYHVGMQFNNPAWRASGFLGSPNGASYELDVLTTAYRNARELALTRLSQEAALLGATGVVGVRVTTRQHEWGEDLLEFAAIGTAIRERDMPAPADATGHRPFLSDLSGQDFWALRRAGFRPVGIAAGNCTYYQIASWSTQRATTGGIFSTWQNMELRDYTQALYEARELAMGRLSASALATGGAGIVGVTAEFKADPVEVDAGNNQRRTDMIYHVSVMGTVIAPAAGASPPTPVTPVVSLQDDGTPAQSIQP